MQEQFETTTAPYVPDNVLFKEFASRTSACDEGNKVKVGKMPPGFYQDDSPRRLSFNDEHFEKFLKQDKKDRLGRDTADMSPKRKRQNPLGDFKFAKINEYF